MEKGRIWGEYVVWRRTDRIVCGSRLFLRVDQLFLSFNLFFDLRHRRDFQKHQSFLPPSTPQKSEITSPFIYDLIGEKDDCFKSKNPSLSIFPIIQSKFKDYS